MRARSGGVGAMVAVTLACLATQASAQVPALDPLDARILSQFKAIADHWNLQSIPRLTEGEAFLSERSGVVTIGRGAVRKIFAIAPTDAQDEVLRWVLAHELSHQVQFRDFGGGVDVSGADAKLLECQADVMAGNLLGETVLDKDLAAFTTAEQQRIGKAISMILDVASNAEMSFEGRLDHPTASQRRIAVRMGVRRAMMSRITLLQGADGSDALGVVLPSMLMTDADTAPKDWAPMICRAILHNGDGAKDLSVGKAAIQWDKPPDPPAVHYSIPFANLGPLTLRATLQVATAAVPRTSPTDHESWLATDAKTFQVDIAPGATFVAEGALSWYGTETVHPRLIIPQDEGSLFDAVRVAEAFEATPQLRRLDKVPPRIKRLGAALMAIARSATSRFDAVRGEPCETDSDARTCPLSIPVPSVRSAEVQYEANGGADVHMPIYSGLSEAAAKAAYEAFLKDVKLAFPDIAPRDRTSNSGSRTSLFMLTPKTGLTIHQYHFEGSTYEVYAEIEQKVM